MYNAELAETFFNSVVRKILPKTVVNEEFMFVVESFDSIVITENSELIRTYPAYLGVQEIIRQILTDYDFGTPYMNLEQDVSFLVNSVKEVILSRYKIAPDTTTQILKPVFYRNKACLFNWKNFFRP